MIVRTPTAISQGGSNMLLFNITCYYMSFGDKTSPYASPGDIVGYCFVWRTVDLTSNFHDICHFYQ